MSKKVLVTGADGFIGSHLTELLVSEGYSVRALVNYNSFNSWGWLDSSAVRSDIEVVSGDIRDPFLCRDITKGMDAIFHLAALIAIPYSYVAPQSYVETNVTGTLNICKAALDNGVAKVVHTSTSEVYGTAQYVPIDEKHPLQPQSPYSASKIASDAMAMSFFNSFGLPLTIARPFNTYGPRQSARAVIPTIIAQIASGKKEISIGDMTPTRDFNYVTDTCRGFLALAANSNCIGKTVNIGSNYEISIKDTLELIKGIMGSNISIQYDSHRVRPKNSEVHRLWCDNTLINSLTGFSPLVNIEQGLRMTVDWFSQRENLAKYKADVYNV
ncbi:NAD-dependent 4,6-dehydratase LegB [Bdellovibrio bacteriovorus]|uniref:Probable UDP-glucose 4-epimerase n=1 Tax=Bdellovibrio bacteriovorus (strain ATCC 15356 / DSM 50701 / NCIMB 9529 / HD100) TaxID=264462 RepID=Q6MMF5_BDEBA|nr:NAD-dependent 4,6-dehydratase LegB [Bdellovibrio bacteriovorus]CAE79549.1 probable UDP-glucose 4-epimerase [Bdellovibrio bacteriovorus HD100]